ncbi:MAG: crosslink repair DNA glycosylase YcaQ family protein [Candidatus Bathyarchaeota archaeon]
MDPDCDLDRGGSYTKETAKEFTLRRLHLTPDTLGEEERDVRPIIGDTGGLQYGGHNIELLNRFREYNPAWLEGLLEENRVMEGHVLRGALRMVTVEDYPHYFKATRVVARRRRYQNCPETLDDIHHEAQRYLIEHGPWTLSEFRDKFGEEHPELTPVARRLVTDLYNHGEVVRVGRRSNKPLFHATVRFPRDLEMDRVSEVDAMEWLFLRCLATYGPFTIREVAHWVGWNLTETRETARRLLDDGRVLKVDIEGDTQTNYLRSVDLPFLESLRGDLPDYSFIRVLYNDDSLLLGCYRRLSSYFGYAWSYPQLRRGDVLRPAVLKGRELIGEASVENLSKSDKYRVRRLTIREKFRDPETISLIEEEFTRHAEFHGKTLEMSRPELYKG